MKTKYHLTFLHKFICLSFFIAAIFFFFNKEYSLYAFDYSSNRGVFNFLQEGEYIVDILYNAAPADNEIIAYSSALTSDTNEIGVELARVAADKQGGKIQFLLELEQNTRYIQFKTTQDTDDVYYISNIRLQTAQVQNTDNYILSFLCIIGAILSAFLGAYVPTEKYMEPFALCLLGFGAGMPLYNGYIMRGHDLDFHISRIESIYLGLRAGEFPVYLGTSQMGGYGTLSSTMYPELFLYPFAILCFFGASLMFCYKALLVCMHIGCAFAAYYGIKNICKSTKTAMWFTIFYTFSIYRLTNTYLRAALGETLAMVFFPLIVWGIYEVFWGNHQKWYILTLGMCGIIQTHVLSVEISLVFLGLETIVWLVTFKQKEYLVRLLSAVKAAILTILLNAFFIVPFLFFCREDLQCFHLTHRLADATATLSQTFSFFAMNHGDEYTPEAMPHTIGANLLLGSILFCIETMRTKEKDTEIELGKHCLAYGVLAVCLASPLFPWDRIQNIDFLNKIVTSIQFAWRFHGPASFFLSITAAIGVVRFAERASEKKWIYALLTAMVITSTGYYFETTGSEADRFSDKMAFDGRGKTDSMYLYNNEDGNDGYEYVNYNHDNAFISARNQTPVTYSGYSRNGIGLQVTVQAQEDSDDYLVFPLYYYPGYEILVNDEAVTVYEMDRKVACELPNGTADIEIDYVGLPAFTVANIVSLLTLVGCIVYMLYKRFSKVNAK